MKKTKFLLPALTIASTAAIVAPFATSCGLDWKPAATASHYAFSAGKQIAYTSKVEPASKKTFTIKTTELVSSLETVAKSACQEVKSNPQGILDDIMLDITGHAQDITDFITYYITGEEAYTDTPTYYKAYAAVYDTASYKVIPDFDEPTILFYFNFDIALDMFIRDFPVAEQSTFASLKLQCRNLPFGVVDYNPIQVHYYPQALAFSSFKIITDASFRVGSDSFSTNIKFTDYNQFFEKENQDIAYMIDWMFDQDKNLYHFKNWVIEKSN